jgi:hypothetical protein
MQFHSGRTAVWLASMSLDARRPMQKYRGRLRRGKSSPPPGRSRLPRVKKERRREGADPTEADQAVRGLAKDFGDSGASSMTFRRRHWQRYRYRLSLSRRTRPRADA